MIKGNTDSYYAALRKKKWRTWAAAALVAGGLNAVMFMLLPALMSSNQDTELLTEVIPRINVIRLKRREEPVRKKQPPPKPEEPKQKKEPVKQETRVVVPKLSMPFELSPSMPNAPSHLELPPPAIGKFNPVGELGGVEQAQLDKVMMPASQVPPVYPLRAKRRGIEGWVRVRFMVDEQGAVGRIQIMEARPESIFDKSVFNCVKKWRYHPGTVEGTAVSVWMETTIKFELE